MIILENGINSKTINISIYLLLMRLPVDIGKGLSGCDSKKKTKRVEESKRTHKSQSFTYS